MSETEEVISWLCQGSNSQEKVPNLRTGMQKDRSKGRYGRLEVSKGGLTSLESVVA